MPQSGARSPEERCVGPLEMSTDCVHFGAGSPRQAVSLPVQDHDGQLLAVADVTLLSCCFVSQSYDEARCACLIYWEQHVD